ncbi:MAG TPA: hypothetical protein VFW50_44570 [Streptosporangiaceae bacterium]|nr:hypothetical protein [Streptosporangiaceae bacterium]
MNLVPAQYREVSVAEVPVPLGEQALREYLTGRDVYRRTRYIIVQHGTASALVEVTKRSEQPLFSPVTTVRLLAGPDETALVDSPGTDTAVPTQLARVALGQAPGARCVIVRGLYGHVSFILDPVPIRVRVLEVVPPWPPKLADQLTRVLDLAEDLPPVELVPELVDLRDLAGRLPADRYLFPCQAGQGSHDPGTPVSYLDEIPEREPWTLVGCARSRSIHDWFYGGDVPQVDMCPRNLAGEREPGLLVTKCCLLEDRVATDGDTVVVPWGASLAQIREGLTLALAAAAQSEATQAAATQAEQAEAAPAGPVPR